MGADEIEAHSLGQASKLADQLVETALIGCTSLVACIPSGQ